MGAAGCAAEPTGGAAGGKSLSYSGDYAVTQLESIAQAAPFHIAKAKGYFEELGLDITAINFAGGSETLQGIRAGMGFGMAATLSAFVSYAKGATDLRILGGYYNKASVVYLAPVDSPINSTKDLRGKRIAVSRPNSITDFFAKLVAQKQGLEVGKDVEILYVGGPAETWTAATQGLADVAWAVQPLQQKLIDAGEAKVVFAARDFVPAWSEDVLVAQQSFIDSNPDVLKAWMGGLSKAITLIHDDVEQAGEIYAGVAQLAVPLATNALRDISEGLTLSIDRPGLLSTIEAARSTGQLTGDLELDDMLMTDFLPDGYDA
jgi:NitT/TauT family transport system substrate-binding protein